MNEQDAPPLSAPEYFRVGGFLIRPTLKAIRPFHGFDAPSSAEKDRRLPDKAIAVLMKLAERPRVVFSREELLDEVWGQDREAYDRVLDNAISELRRAFGDDARKPRYIETITKQGYRLIAQVEWPEPAGGAPAGGEDELGTDELETPAAARAAAAAGADRLEKGRSPSELDAPAAEMPVDGAVDSPGEASAAPPPEPGDVLRVESARPAEATDSARTRGFYRLFAMLALVLLIAATATLLSGRDSLAFWIAEMPNRTGNAAYDDLRSRVRDRLARSECSASGAEETRYSFMAGIFISGGAELESGGIRLGATVQSRGAEALRARADGSAGRRPDRLIEDLVGQIEEQVELALCDRGSSCHCSRMARRRLQEKRLNQAKTYIDRALELAEVDLDVLDLSIEISFARGERQTAEASLESARELAVDAGEVWRHRLERRRAQLDGDVAAENAALIALWRLQPEHSRWPLELGVSELRHGRNCGEIASWLQKAEERGDERSLPAMARFAAACGDLERALRHAEAFLDRHPGRADAEVLMAELLRLGGSYEEADDRLSRAASAVPDYAPMQLERARLQMAQGYFELAIEEFDAFQRLAPWPRGAHDGAIGQALAALQLGRAGDALRQAELAEIAWFEGDVAAPLPPSVEVLWVRGWALVLQGESEKALAQAALIEEQCSSRGRCLGLDLRHHLVGLVASSRGDWADAVDAFYDAVSRRPSDATFFRLELARAFVGAEKEAKAEENLLQVLAVNPSHAPALCELGRLRQVQGELEAARELYRQAFESWNEQPEDEPMRDCRRRQRELET